jgi:hypothetical protein
MSDRFERTAARRNAKEDGRYPLLAWAGLTVHTTAAEAEVKHGADQAYAAQRAADYLVFDAEMLTRAACRRAQLEALLGPEAGAALEAYRARTYPPKAVFAADFWRRKLEEAQAGSSLADLLDYRWISASQARGRSL